MQIIITAFSFWLSIYLLTIIAQKVFRRVALLKINFPFETTPYGGLLLWNFANLLHKKLLVNFLYLKANSLSSNLFTGYNETDQ